MTPSPPPLQIIPDLSDNLVDLLLIFVEAALGTIGWALWYILGWFLEGYGTLILRTPYPEEGGEPAYWVSDSGALGSSLWGEGYDMYYEQMLPVAFLLIGIAFVLNHFGHLLSQFPMMNNLNPSLGRVFFIMIMVGAWWTIMVGVLSFSDALAVTLAGGTSIEETMGDPMSPPGEDNSGDNDNSDNDSWFINEIDSFVNDQLPGDENEREAGWAAGATIVLMLALQLLTLVTLVIFWVVRYMLVVMLGVGMPIFLALRAYEGTGVPIVGNIGKQAWDLWWFCVFMPLPAALVLRLGSFIGHMGEAMGGSVASGLLGTIVSSLATLAVPILAGIIPMLFYRRAMSQRLPGRMSVTGLSRKGAQQGQKSVGMASTYARSDERTRRGRFAEAIDENTRGSDASRRIARRLSYGKDVYDGVEGNDPATHDRYGRTTDAGGRSIFHNASNIAASEATNKGNQIAEAVEEGVEKATGRDVDVGRLSGPDRDINVDHIAGNEFDELDVMREDLENMSRSEIRRKLRAERERQDVEQRFQKLANAAEESEMNFEERYKQVMDGDGEDLRHLLQMTDDKMVKEEVLDREQQRIYDDLLHRGADSDLIDDGDYGISEDDTRDAAAAKFLERTVENDDLQDAMVKDLQFRGFSDDESIEDALDNVLGSWEDQRYGYANQETSDGDEGAEAESEADLPAKWMSEENLPAKSETTVTNDIDIREGDTISTPGEDMTQQRIRSSSTKVRAEADNGSDSAGGGVDERIGRRQLDGETESVITTDSGVEVIGEPEEHEVNEDRITKSVDYREKETASEGEGADNLPDTYDGGSLPETDDEDDDEESGGTGSAWRNS